MTLTRGIGGGALATGIGLLATGLKHGTSE